MKKKKMILKILNVAQKQNDNFFDPSRDTFSEKKSEHEAGVKVVF